MDFWFNTVCINLDVGIFSHLQLQQMTYCATLYPSIKKSGSYDELQSTSKEDKASTISDKTFGLKRNTSRKR